MEYFTWGVAREGYRWCDACPIIEGRASSTSARFLTPGFTLTWKRYSPLEDTPALFRTFADVLPTEEEIQGFASQYGSLGVHESIVMPNKQSALGERFETWCQEIVAMQHAIRVWEALERRDGQALHACFTRPDQCPPIVLSHNPGTPWPWDVGTLRATPQFRQEEWQEELLFRFPGPGIPTDIAGYALVWLRARVNSQLQDLTRTRLDYVPDSTAVLPMELNIVPANLLGALWLQLARAMEGKGRQQRCPQCKQWFAVPAKAQRASTTYCSPRCRVKAARKRLAHATQENGQVYSTSAQLKPARKA